MSILNSIMYIIWWYIYIYTVCMFVCFLLEWGNCSVLYDLMQTLRHCITFNIILYCFIEDIVSNQQIEHSGLPGQHIE